MIASLYIKEHPYLFDKPQTLNFGGKYLYSFIEIGEDLILRKKMNKAYIPNFFNISTDCDIKIDSISAIVGENGIGKSSILDIFSNTFIQKNYSRSNDNSVFIIEEDGMVKTIKSNFNVFFIINDDNNDDDEKIRFDFKIKRTLKSLDPKTNKFDDSYKLLDSINVNDYQSIYYSPHFDLKFNNKISDTNSYDISLDQYINTDLDGTEQKGTNENGWRFPLHEELLFKNSLRQIEFLVSDIFKKNQILETFNLPKYEFGTLIFREVEEKDDYWNIPRQFVSVVKLIKEKLKIELDDWTKVRKFDKSHKRVINQVEVNQYILKRFIISAILSVIYKMMNERNTFLEEGLIEDSVFFETNNLTAEELFLGFIDRAYTNLGKSKNKIFNAGVFESFFEEIKNLIDEEIDEYNVTNQRLNVKVDNIENILKLHRNMVKDFFNYYLNYDSNYKKNNNLYEFLSFRPLVRNLSSGENAMLNFYSKLYSFIDNNFNNTKYHLPSHNNYILLLDEADLGFHPAWKKKYINTILNTIPYFFEKLNTKPIIQIIFATHDSLTLSDVPNNSVVYLKKDGKYSKVLTHNDADRPQKTFGANIHELLADSFFVGDGLIGDFAKNKIAITLSWLKIKANELNELSKGEKFIYEIDSTIDIPKFENKEEEFNYHRQIIELIDEPLVKNKLKEMFIEYANDKSQFLNYELEKAKQKVQELEERLKNA